MQLDSGGRKCGHQWLCGLEATITIRVSLWRTLQAIIHHCIAHTPQSQPCTRKPGHLTLVAAPDLVATTIRLSVLPITKVVLNIKLLLVFLTPRSSIEMTPCKHLVCWGLSLNPRNHRGTFSSLGPSQQRTSIEHFDVEHVCVQRNFLCQQISFH